MPNLDLQHGKLETAYNEAITNRMFLIMQIQTGGVAGTPNNSELPAFMIVNSVTITDSGGNTIFSDAFPNQYEPARRTSGL